MYKIKPSNGDRIFYWGIYNLFEKIEQKEGGWFFAGCMSLLQTATIESLNV